MLLQNSPEKILDPYPGYLSRKVVTQSNSADLRALKYQKTFPTSPSPPFPEKRGKKKKKRGGEGGWKSLSAYVVVPRNRFGAPICREASLLFSTELLASVRGCAVVSTRWWPGGWWFGRRLSKLRVPL